MQEYLHANYDEVLQAIKRFEKMLSTDKIEYFDVHQIENIYDFYFDKNKIKKAGQVLNIGLKQHPGAASLIVKKAMHLAEQGELDAALKMLESVAAIESTNPDVFLTMGWIMLQKGKISKALEYYWQAVNSAYDEQEEVLLEVSYNLNQHELYLESVTFLKVLLKQAPNNESALFEYAFSLDKNLEYKKSIAAYKRLLTINPFSENGWYNLGVIYSKLGLHEEAGKAYAYTLAINPKHPEAHFNSGNSLVQSGFFAEALDAYTEHLALGDDGPLVYQYIGDCWEQLGNYPLAIRFYQQVIKIAPKQADAWYGLGTTLMETDKFEDGLQAIDQAIAINPLNADYWFAHARGLFELEKTEDAARSLENGLNLDPSELSGWFELLKLKIILNKDFDIEAYVLSLHDQNGEMAAIHYLTSVAYYHYLDCKDKALLPLREAIYMDADGLKTLADDYPDMVADKDIEILINSIINRESNKNE
ncbi:MULTISPECIES: tetratricopeptide repeat protein [unclassified Carboxylicivirga]|uniref:tetratricopeptide repeat protein n=1 Tax=Carboxylicivirga TaxID=1628153 RepID=UPI003D347D88